jgi:transcription antitermination factor NusG
VAHREKTENYDIQAAPSLGYRSGPQCVAPSQFLGEFSDPCFEVKTGLSLALYQLPSQCEPSGFLFARVILRGQIRSGEEANKEQTVSTEFWGSLGGSLSVEGIMRMHNHQWPWFAILVRRGEEKSATLLLENAGYECFLPLTNCNRQFGDRADVISLPLFSGYLFCRMNPHNRLPVLRTPGVIQIVGVGEKPIPVEEDEIVGIQRVVKSGLPTMPWPYLQVGQVGRVQEGPLRGLTGIVVKIKMGMKLVQSVNLLQRSLAVEIDRSWLSPVQAVKPTEEANVPRIL